MHSRLGIKQNVSDDPATGNKGVGDDEVDGNATASAHPQKATRLANASAISRSIPVPVLSRNLRPHPTAGLSIISPGRWLSSSRLESGRRVTFPGDRTQRGLRNLQDRRTWSWTQGQLRSTDFRTELSEAEHDASFDLGDHANARPQEQHGQHRNYQKYVCTRLS